MQEKREKYVYKNYEKNEKKERPWIFINRIILDNSL